MPDPPGATTDGCVVSGRLSRLTAIGNVMTGHRAGPDRGLVPAVPEPLDRRPRLRRRRRPLRERRRRRELQLRRLRAERHPARIPCGDPPVPVGGVADAADRRGRRAAQPGLLRTAGDPVAARRHHPPRRPDDRRGAAGQPALRQRRRRTRGASSPTACATRSGSRSGRARARSGSATSAGTPGRRSTASPTPTAGGRELRLALLRRHGQQPATTAANLDICENLYATPGAVTLPFFTYNHADQVVAGRDLPDRQLVGHRPRLLRRRQLSRELRRRALLRRLLAQLHLGDVPGRRRAARPDDRRDLRAPGAATPGRPRDRAGRRPLLRRPRRRHDPARSSTSRPTPSPTAAPDDRRGSARRSTSTASGSSDPRPATRSPTPGTSTATAASTTRRASADRSPTRAAAATRRACGSPTPRRLDRDATRRRSPPATRRPTAIDRLRRLRRSPGTSATRSPSPAPPRIPQDGTLPASRAVVDAHHPPLPVELPRAPGADVRRASRAAPSPRPTTSTRRTSSCSSRRPTRAALDGHARACRSIRRPSIARRSSRARPGSSLVVGNGSGDDAVHRDRDRRLAELPSSRRRRRRWAALPYGFAFWSDGGAASHSIVAGASPATYVATYTAADLSSAAGASPVEGLSGGDTTY